MGQVFSALLSTTSNEGDDDNQDDRSMASDSLIDDDEDEIDRKGENWLLDDQKYEDGDKDANDGDN